MNNAITHYCLSELCVNRARVGGCYPEITLFSNRVSFACESDNTVTDTLVRCGLYRLHQYCIGLAVVAPKPFTDKRFDVHVSSIIQLRTSMFSSISLSGTNTKPLFFNDQLFRLEVISTGRVVIGICQNS